MEQIELAQLRNSLIEQTISYYIHKFMKKPYTKYKQK